LPLHSVLFPSSLSCRRATHRGGNLFMSRSSHWRSPGKANTRGFVIRLFLHRGRIRLDRMHSFFLLLRSRHVLQSQHYIGA
jgi:hypothetical protein